jgi:hypothetical protein
MSITDLVYRLTADGQPFSKELQKAEKDVDKFQKKAASGVAKLGKAFAAVGVAAAGALAVLVRDSINAADEIGKMSDRIGISTEDLSKFGFAAEQSGSSLEGFERGAKALSKSIVDAANGTGKAAATFDRLGISATDVDGNIRDTVDVIKDLSDRFAELPGGAEKAALAQELFGKAGGELIPLLDQGSAGLEAFGEQAEALGLVIGDKTAREAAAFNDNLNLLKKTSTGFANQVAVQALPTLVAYSNRLVASSKDANGLAKSTGFISTGIKIILTVVESVIGVFKGLGETLGALLALIFNFGKQAIKVFQAFGRNIKAVGKAFTQALQGDFSGAFETIKGTLGDTIGTIGDGFKSQIEIISEAYGQVSGIVKDTVVNIGDIWTGEAPAVEAAVEEATKSTFRPIKTALEGQKKGFVEAAKAADEYAKRLEKNLASTLALIETDAEKLAGAILDLDELFEAGAITIGQYDAAVAILKDRYDEATIAGRRLAEEGERLAESLRTPLEIYQASAEQFERLFEAGAISRETYDRALEASTVRLGESLKKTGDEVEKLGITLETSAGALFDVLGSALFDPLNASFEDMVVNFAKALAQMAIEAAKAQALQALLSAGTGGLGGAGGALPGFASGGYISGPGTGTSDSITARLSNGEFVMRAAAVRKYGVGFMAAINSMKANKGGTPRFADGGLVGAGGGDMSMTNVNFVDQTLFEDFISSRKGERLIVNVIRRNKGALA